VADSVSELNLQGTVVTVSASCSDTEKRCNLSTQFIILRIRSAVSLNSSGRLSVLVTALGTESSIIIYVEWRLLGCYAMWLL
jgi:hypothetical protein